MTNFVCPKCGTIKKSGKRSCCARDGAWFKNCGDGDDTQFDHTWTEGIQACRSARNSFSILPPPKSMLPIVYFPKPTELQNVNNQNTNVHHTGVLTNVVVSSYEDCPKLAKTTICISVMLLIFIY